MADTPESPRVASEHEARLRRLRLRSWRRGTKEMDLIFGGFADHQLGALSSHELDAHEALMEENDVEIYAWLIGQTAAPEIHAQALARVKAHLGAQSFQAKAP